MGPVGKGTMLGDAQTVQHQALVARLLGRFLGFVLGAVRLFGGAENPAQAEAALQLHDVDGGTILNAVGDALAPLVRGSQRRAAEFGHRGELPTGTDHVERASGLLDVAHDGVQAAGAQRRLGSAFHHVGSNAVGNAAAAIQTLLVAAHIQLDGFLDLLRIQPAELGRTLEGPEVRLLLVDLAGGLAGLAVHLGFAEDARVHAHLFGHAEGQRLHFARALFDAEVHRRVVGGGGLVALDGVLGLDGQPGVGINQAGQVGPVLRELLVVELVLEDVAIPGQDQAAVRTGTQGQVDGGLGGVGGQHGVDDDGLAAVGTQFGHAAAGAGGLGRGRLGTPEHQHLAIVLDAGGFVNLGEALEGLAHGVVCHGVGGAEAHELSHAQTGHPALGSAGLECGGREARSRSLGRNAGVDVGTAATGGAHHGIGAVFLEDLEPLVRGLFDGLIPADALEGHVLCTAGAGTAHGVQNAARAVAGVNLVQALDAR